MTIKKTAVMSSATSDVNIKIFSVLKFVTALTGQSTRYNLPAVDDLTDSFGSRTPVDTLRLYTTFQNTLIPGSTSNETSNFIIKPMDFEGSTIRYSVSLDFLYSLKYEYCYWASLLKVIIGNLFTIYSTSFAATTGTAETAAETTAKNLVQLRLINAAVSINTRLNDLSSIIAYIKNQQATELTTTIGEVNRANASIANSQANINQAVNTLSKSDGLLKLRSRMVEFNDEKNNYASTLLSLYGFANLVAIGLLFYIYKS